MNLTLFANKSGRDLTNYQNKHFRGGHDFTFKYYVTILFVCMVVGMMAVVCFESADAQLLPIPGPFQGKVSEKDKAAANDYHPPKITLVTEKLYAGKNVFKIRIADKSNIDFCTITYVNSGTVKTNDCVYDQADLYKSLIESTSPEQRIEIHAEDGNGNSATRMVKVPVASQSNVFQKIIDRVFPKQ
jgi:hypothetical protein